MNFDICEPPWAAIEYALRKTVMDLYDLTQVKNITTHQQRKSLGDFSVSYGNSNRFPIPKEDKLNEELVDLARTLRGFCGTRGNIQGVIKGINNATMPWPATRKRTWTSDTINRHQQLANTERERDLKYPRVNDVWS
jgi:hypothetical protein